MMDVLYRVASGEQLLQLYNNHCTITTHNNILSLEGIVGPPVVDVMT